MTDEKLESTLAAARRAGPAWTSGRQQQLKWALMAKVDALIGPSRRWRQIPVLIPVLGALAMIAIGFIGWRHLVAPAPAGGSHAPLTTASAARAATGGSAERALPRLTDGSSIVLDGPSAVLKKIVETDDEVGFQLEAGGAHFEVTRRPSRIFRVHAGGVTVQVIGTRFHVQRQAARSHISVDRGKVLVSWWGGSRELTTGEEGTFPPDLDTKNDNKNDNQNDNRTGTDNGAAIPAPLVPQNTTTAPSGRPSPLYGHDGHTATSEKPYGTATPAALFARADRARAAGKPELAIVHLKEILDRHPADPHAPMAAFTEGRLFLESLGQPHQAARAFARARALANGGPLAEDALAREVEALHAADEAALAHQRAELYRRLFPNGPRLPAVARFGGLRAAP
jgi:hypothetical protein